MAARNYSTLRLPEGLFEVSENNAKLVADGVFARYTRGCVKIFQELSSCQIDKVSILTGKTCYFEKPTDTQPQIEDYYEALPHLDPDDFPGEKRTRGLVLGYGLHNFIEAEADRQSTTQNNLIGQALVLGKILLNKEVILTSRSEYIDPTRELMFKDAGNTIHRISYAPSLFT